MKKFLKTLFYFTILPFCFFLNLVYLYLKQDPFEDFSKKNNYSWQYTFQSLGDLSTKKILDTKYKYNSFIFGSSRSISLHACYLQNKIPDSKFLHYASWTETIGGIYAKLHLLDSLNFDLKNVIIYIDTDVSFQNDGNCRDNDHFLLTKKNKYDSYYSHFQSFIPPNIDQLKILFNKKPSNKTYAGWQSDLITNDANHYCSDSSIIGYGKIHYNEKYNLRIDAKIKSGFFKKIPSKPQFLKSQISGDEEKLLDKILLLFLNKKTNYKIVITPLYNQKVFAESDFAILNSKFGKRLFDFSGKNIFTENKNNYADKIHFSDLVSKTIIDSVLKF